MLLSIWWDMQVDALQTRVDQLTVRIVAGIGARRRRLASKVHLDLGQHGRQLLLVVGLGDQVLGDDDLVRIIDHDLGVVGLLESLGCAILHDLRFGIGEVALILGLRRGGGRIGGDRLRTTDALAALRRASSPLGQRRLHLGLLSLGSTSRLLLQGGFRFADLRQTLL